MQVNVTSYSIKEVFDKAKKPLVVVGENADVDLTSLAAALMEIFESYDKKAFIISRSEIHQAVKPLVKAENQKEKVDPKSLVLSLDWKKNHLEKVSYDMEGDNFNLVIRATGKPIDPNEISYSTRGQDYDLLVTIGFKKQEELLALGIDEDLLLTTASVNFDKSEQNTNFGKLNIVHPKVDSLCALAVKLFAEAKITLPTRSADALLFGIRTATENFTKVNDPQTFESAAYCKRAMIPGAISQTSEPETPKKETKVSTESESWLSPKIFRSGRIS